MAISLLDKVVNDFGDMMDTINLLIGFVNDNDPANLTTTDKSSLVAGINEVNAKKLRFFKKDGSQANISLEV